MTPSATDDRSSSGPTNRLRPKVRNENSDPDVVCLLVGENLTDDQCIPTDLEVSRKK